MVEGAVAAKLKEIEDRISALEQDFKSHIDSNVRLQAWSTTAEAPSSQPVMPDPAAVEPAPES